MGPELPSGRETRAAWRALSPYGRQAAWAAAKTGASPGDLGVGLAAAGYGRRASRVLRVLLGLVPLLFIVVVVVLASAAAERGLSVDLFFGLLPLVLLLYAALMLVLRRQIRRYRALYESGMLAVEAAEAGALAPAGDPGAWRQDSYQSEFTVPYQAALRAAVPVAEPRRPADPVRAGVQLVRTGREAIALRLLLSGLVCSILWCATGTFDVGGPAVPLRIVVFAIAVGYTLLLLLGLVSSLPLLRNPTVARFAPDGWSLPYLRIGAGWTAVREIRVRAAVRRGGLGRRPVRVVVLVVDEPEALLDRVRYPQRLVARRNLRYYGSPAVIPTSSPSTPVAQLVTRLREYTDAPVAWG